ncbi:MAG TPA: vWA domain-containing protein [Polyangia bacterium]|nr:vWA domain-containing protein [Polyangia bacterium]
MAGTLTVLMTNPRALLSAFAIATLCGCAGTKQMPSATGQGSTGGSLGTSTGGAGAVVATGSGGSGSSTPPGGDVGVTGSGGTGNNCGLYQFQPTPKNADILMVLDRSGSMEDVPEGAPSGSTTTKWQIVVPAMEQIVTATQSSISWGLKTFPEAASDGKSDCAGPLGNTPDVPMAAKDGATMTGTIAATTPNGNGTPTGDAIKAAATYLKSVSDPNPKYLLLATDGEPTCVGTSNDSDSAGPYAVQAVTDALAAGFPTFVVGIATTKTNSNARLNALAQAGGEASASVNPLATHYYLANDASGLQAALQAITGQISSCLFPLKDPPPVPNDSNKTGVYLGSSMTKIPYDAAKANGWAYVDSADSAIEIYGNWCQMVQADGAGAVQIIFGCPNIDVP